MAPLRDVPGDSLRVVLMFLPARSRGRLRRACRWARMLPAVSSRVRLTGAPLPSAVPFDAAPWRDTATVAVVPHEEALAALAEVGAATVRAWLPRVTEVRPHSLYRGTVQHRLASLFGCDKSAVEWNVHEWGENLIPPSKASLRPVRAFGETDMIARRVADDGSWLRGRLARVEQDTNSTTTAADLATIVRAARRVEEGGLCLRLLGRVDGAIASVLPGVVQFRAACCDSLTDAVSLLRALPDVRVLWLCVTELAKMLRALLDEGATGFVPHLRRVCLFHCGHDIRGGVDVGMRELTQLRVARPKLGDCDIVLCNTPSVFQSSMSHESIVLAVAAAGFRIGRFVGCLAAMPAPGTPLFSSLQSATRVDCLITGGAVVCAAAGTDLHARARAAFPEAIDLRVTVRTVVVV